MLTTNRLRYHYQAVLRQDLLQKCSHSSIMSIPKLLKITLCARVPYDNLQRKQLSLEILSGQKAVCFQSSVGGLSSMSKVKRSLTGGRPLVESLGIFEQGGTKLRFHKGMKQPQYFVRTCLRGPILFQFLEKLNTFWFFQDISIRIKNNTIELTAPYRILRLFPEIQNHFGQLSVQNLQVIVHTSSQNEEETRLISSSLLTINMPLTNN
jgi:ribosomal protein L5